MILVEDEKELAEAQAELEIVTAARITTAIIAKITNVRIFINWEAEFPDVDFKGDFKELEDSIEMIIASLSAAFGNIHQSSEQVSMGA